MCAHGITNFVQCTLAMSTLCTHTWEAHNTCRCIRCVLNVHSTSTALPAMTDRNNASNQGLRFYSRRRGFRQKFIEPLSALILLFATLVSESDIRKTQCCFCGMRIDNAPILCYPTTPLTDLQSTIDQRNMFSLMYICCVISHLQPQRASSGRELQKHRSSPEKPTRPRLFCDLRWRRSN